MRLVEFIAQRVSDVGQSTADHAANQAALLNDALELYAKAFQLAKPSDQPDQAMARMSLVSYNFNTLYLASQAARTGFYLQSLSMLRPVYENWLAFWYLEKFPTQAHLWLEARPDRRPPGAERMRNRIDVPSAGTKSGIHRMYQILSRFSHTDPVVALSHYREIAGYPHVHVGVEFDNDAFLSSTYGLALWTGLMLEAVSSWIPQDASWHGEVDHVAQRILEYLEWYDAQPQPGAA